MSALRHAAIYTLGAIGIYSLTGYTWIIPIAGIVIISAMARHIYTEK